MCKRKIKAKVVEKCNFFISWKKENASPEKKTLGTQHWKKHG